MAEPVILLEMPAADPPAESAAQAAPGPPKLQRVDRNPLKMLMLDVDSLLAADHKARAIWRLTGKLDLRGFLVGIRSEVGPAG